MSAYAEELYGYDAVRTAVALLAAHIDGDQAGQDVIAGSASPAVLHVLAGMALSAYEHLARDAGFTGEQATEMVRAQFATFLSRLPA